MYAGPREIGAVSTLRINVTQRCDFRRLFSETAGPPIRENARSLLSFDEIALVVQAAIEHGIGAFKLTGGEPLLRRDFPHLVALLRSRPGVRELSLKTDGRLLEPFAQDLKQAGLDRVTVRLDTLDRKKYKILTRGASLDRVWQGIAAAVAAGFPHPKINCVVIRGVNDDELIDFADLTMKANVTVRFVEYMPGEATCLGGRHDQRFVPEQVVRDKLTLRFGSLQSVPTDAGCGPARLCRLPDAAGKVGFISPVSAPFCESCNRLRLSPTGVLKSCVFEGSQIDLRPILRRRTPSADRDDIVARLHAVFRDCPVAPSCTAP